MDSTNPTSPIAAFFSHGFLAVLTGIIGLLSSSLVLHLLPNSIAAVIVGVAAGWKAYSDAIKQQQTTAAVNVAASAAVTAKETAERTDATLRANPSIAKAQTAMRDNPLQGGAPR